MASFTLPKYASLTSLRLFAPAPTTLCSGEQMQHCRHEQYWLRGERIARKSVTCTASSQGQASQQGKDVFDRALLALYQKETPTISMLLEEIDQRGRIDEVVEDVSGEPMTEADRREIVKAVVEKHWEEMTEAIIMVLAGYAQASYSEGHTKVAETLEMIREEVLAKSLKQLPPEMQALELLAGMFNQSSEERVNATKELAGSDKAGRLQCELPALRTTASQMLEDMEEKRGLIDAELLAKLCIVREEIDVAATELGMYEEGTDYFRLMSTTWRLLPAGNAAFVKELMHVSDENKRRALLTACIKHDFQKDPEDTRLQSWVLQGVRPGRLTNTISALVANLKQEGVQPDCREYARLQDIKNTAFELLNEMVS